jgi:hypothetical protein
MAEDDPGGCDVAATAIVFVVGTVAHRTDRKRPVRGLSPVR